MGSSKKVTVGYWYKLLLYYGISRGPIDAFLEFRGGDRTAWAGKVTESGTIQINAPELWGGEKSEGGITGSVDLMFGEQDQIPNAWLAANLSTQQSAMRGRFCFLFKGGRFGINPYPKGVAFKFRRILKGWDNDDPWYPEKAEVPLSGTDSGYLVQVVAVGGSFSKPSPDGVDWSGPVTGSLSSAHVMGATDRFIRWDSTSAHYTLDGVNWIASTGTFGGSGGVLDAIEFQGNIFIAGGINGLWASTDRGASYAYIPGSPRTNCLAHNGEVIVSSYYGAYLQMSNTGFGGWSNSDATGLLSYPFFPIAYGDDVFRVGGRDAGLSPRVVISNGGATIIADSLPGFASATTVTAIAYGEIAGDRIWVLGTDSGELAFKKNTDPWQISADSLTDSVDDIRFTIGRFVAICSAEAKDSTDGDQWGNFDVGFPLSSISAGATLDTRSFALIGMNPAHMIYDALTSEDMQGEPLDNVNEATFMATADRLWTEGFGLNTIYDHKNETSEQFQERILNVIGGVLTQSRIDGKYRLDLIRGDYDPETLPVLTDADILEYSREPSNPRDSVNEVIVEWFDPEKKEKRATQPIHSLGAIRDAGAIISETGKYPEIPWEPLATRVAARDLARKCNPQSRFKLSTTRVTHDWRNGTFFRLQSPRRGIADMVCMVLEISAGTLRSGAMSLVVLQDVAGMPDSTYLEVEPGIDTTPSQTPDNPSAQGLLEAPYFELAGTLPNAELSALPEDAGYLLTNAARPATGINYALYTRADGEEFADQGVSDWTPSALVVEAATADPDVIAFTLQSATDLDRVEVGTAALWGSELVRVDAIDAVSLTATFARAIGDTVLQEHAAGQRVWFYDAWAGTDQREYVDGEMVYAKMLTRTSTQQLSLALASTVSLTMDQRAARPYPPANVTVDGEHLPTDVITGAFDVEWSHRDRVLQADQLVEWTAASIGPEAGVTYTARFYDVDDDAVPLLELGPTAGDSFAAVELDFTGGVRLELVAERDGLTCWQPAVVFFDIETDPSGITLRRAEDNDLRRVEGTKFPRFTED